MEKKRNKTQASRNTLVTMYLFPPFPVTQLLRCSVSFVHRLFVCFLYSYSCSCSYVVISYIQETYSISIHSEDSLASFVSTHLTVAVYVWQQTSGYIYHSVLQTRCHVLNHNSKAESRQGRPGSTICRLHITVYTVAATSSS